MYMYVQLSPLQVQNRFQPLRVRWERQEQGVSANPTKLDPKLHPASNLHQASSTTQLWHAVDPELDQKQTAAFMQYSKAQVRTRPIWEPLYSVFQFLFRIS